MKNDLFEKAKQAVAEKHGRESWLKLFRRYRQSTALGDSGMAGYIQEAAELYAQWVANEAVKADRDDLNKLCESTGLYIARAIKNRPLPFPQQPDGI